MYEYVNKIKKEANDEMSLRIFVLLLIDWFKYIKSKFWIIAAFILLGGITGFAIAKFSAKKYTATTTFFVDEGKGSSDGGGLSLLGLADPSKDNSLFRGDNLKYLYTSRLMLKRVLLSPLSNDDSSELLINRLIKIDNSVKKLFVTSKKFQNIKFVTTDENNINDVNKNEFICFCVDVLKNKYITVKDVEKTEGLIAVDVKSGNEMFAKQFSVILVNTVNQYYIQSKTKKAQKEVNDFENQTDQYNKQMNTSFYSTADAVESVPYPNPNKQIIKVKTKRIGIDADLNSAIYTQLMQRLELARMDLQKVTPLIQVIDQPALPLPLSGKSPVIYTTICSFVSLIFCLGVLTIRRILKGILA